MTFEKIVNLATIGKDEVFGSVKESRLPLRHYSCYQEAVDVFHKQCYNLGKVRIGVDELWKIMF